MATHKADGLFYVTDKMLSLEFACWGARMAVHNDAKMLGLEVGDSYRSKREYMDEVKVPITLDIMHSVCCEAIGVTNWMKLKVPGFCEAMYKLHPSRINLYAVELMDVLYQLAVERGLVKP